MILKTKMRKCNRPRNRNWDLPIYRGTSFKSAKCRMEWKRSTRLMREYACHLIITKLLRWHSLPLVIGRSQGRYWLGYIFALLISKLFSLLLQFLCEECLSPIYFILKRLKYVKYWFQYCIILKAYL